MGEMLQMSSNYLQMAEMRSQLQMGKMLQMLDNQLQMAEMRSQLQMGEMLQMLSDKLQMAENNRAEVSIADGKNVTNVK